MEELKTFLVNIDFEESLKSQDFSFPVWQKINRELEYLFFWQDAPQGILWTKEDFSDEYASYIKNLVGHQPEWTCSGQPQNLWWGKIRNNEEYQNQRQLNSKVVACHSRKKLGLEPFISSVCNTQDDLNREIQRLKENDFVIKEEFAFSGRGIHFNEHKGLKLPLVIEPWVKRIRDFSLFERNGEVQCIQSQVNHQGTYKGSLIKPQISERSELIDKFYVIKEYYQSEYNAFEVQLDSFQFLNDSKLEFQFLGEINHRRTLGTSFYDLHLKFGGEVSFLAVLQDHQLKTKDFSKTIEALGKLQYNPVIKSGVICLTPEKRKLNLFFITEESERVLQFLVRDFWKAIVKDNYRLPPEFIVYL